MKRLAALALVLLTLACPAQSRLRVIMDNDFSGDPDGLFALAHLALSPSVDIRAVIGSHLRKGDGFDPSTHQADNAAQNARDLLTLLHKDVRVIAGSNTGMVTDSTPVRDPAVDVIIQEAKRTDTKEPLYILCGAGLTEVASALLTEPSIAGRFTLVWIGGPEYDAAPPPGYSTPEYNLAIDIDAARAVFNRTKVMIWQVPRDAYRQALISHAQLETQVKPRGAVGAYLAGKIDTLLQRLRTYHYNTGETYILGDSPLVLLTALQSSFEPDPSSCTYVVKPAPRIDPEGRYVHGKAGRPVRVYTRLDTRLLFDDFFAKLSLPPTLYADSAKALIYEGDDYIRHWRINPREKLDVCTITKSRAPKSVRFCTDHDTLSLTLSPGERVDFDVELKGARCHTRIESPALKDYSALNETDTIPFTLTDHNNLLFDVVVNGNDSLKVIFDSGTTGLLLDNDVYKKEYNSVKIGRFRWDSLDVYPVALSGHGSAGRFGWDLFDGKIVEIDYDKQRFIVHTRLPDTTGYTALPIEYTHELFCIKGSLEVKGISYPGRFLYDDGYERTILLDTAIVAETGYPRDQPVLKKSILRNGRGQEFPVVVFSNERLVLGNLELSNIPAQLLATANPARFKTHILGGEVLKRFNTLLDFQHDVVYLKPNSLKDVAYADAQGSGAGSR